MNNHKIGSTGQALFSSITKIIGAQQKGRIHQPKQNDHNFSRAVSAHITGCRDNELPYSILHKRSPVSFYRIKKEGSRLDAISADSIEQQNGLVLVASHHLFDHGPLTNKFLINCSYQYLAVKTAKQRVIADMGQVSDFSIKLAVSLQNAEFEDPMQGKFFEKANSTTLVSGTALPHFNDADIIDLKILATGNHSKGHKSRIVADVNILAFSDSKYGYRFVGVPNSGVDNISHPDIRTLAKSNNIGHGILSFLEWVDKSFSATERFLNELYTFLKQGEQKAVRLFLLIRGPY